MIENDFSSKFRLLLLLVITPFLVGSQCTVLFNSGGNDDDKDKDEEDIVVVAASGVFGSSPIEGVDYTSGTIRGVTGRNGEFKYEPGSPVQFSIGDIELGEAVEGQSLITVTDLAPDSAADTSAAINMKRLIKSLDVDPTDELITIPAQVRSLAVNSNGSLSASIEFLDFSDDAVFANTASALVAVLTQDYPFTAMLQDADTASEKTGKSP
jgi:hypothetical protein